MVCENCEFWKKVNKWSNNSGSGGECHRFPPVGVISHQDRWPVSFSNECCGEFKEDIDPEPEDNA